MKIKYLKDAPNGPEGMVDEVSDFHGGILIKTGHAELYTEPKPKAKPKTKTDKE